VSEVVGVDGCRAGWVVATRSEVRVVDRLDLIDAEAIGVDMPIGLASNGRRACDFKAREFLGSRRSTIFLAPPRGALHATTFAKANELCRAFSGKGLSIQAFNLFPKIRQVDDWVTADDDQRIVEVHPECAFATMCSGDPLPSKHTREGIQLRMALLEQEFGTVKATPRGAKLDDVLDAYAVLWSTERFLAGVHRTFGEDERDERNLPMRIVC
jgi:predicted RNase H-like nuclease